MKEAPEKDEPRSKPLRDLSRMRDLKTIRPARSHFGGNRIKNDEIRCGISAAVGRPGKTMRRAVLRVSFGTTVMNSVRWQAGDSLQVLFDDDYLFLRRSVEGTYCLAKNTKNRTNVMKTAITLYPPMPFFDSPTTIRTWTADFVHQDDGLLIAWPTTPAGRLNEKTGEQHDDR